MAIISMDTGYFDAPLHASPLLHHSQVPFLAWYVAQVFFAISSEPAHWSSKLCFSDAKKKRISIKKFKMNSNETCEFDLNSITNYLRLNNILPVLALMQYGVPSFPFSFAGGQSFIPNPFFATLFAIFSTSFIGGVQYEDSVPLQCQHCNPNAKLKSENSWFLF